MAFREIDFSRFCFAAQRIKKPCCYKTKVGAFDALRAKSRRNPGMCVFVYVVWTTATSKKSYQMAERLNPLFIQ